MKKPAPKVDCSELIKAAVDSADLRNALNALITAHGVSAVVYELSHAIWADADLTQDKSARDKKLRAAYVLTNALHRL